MMLQELCQVLRAQEWPEESGTYLEARESSVREKTQKGWYCYTHSNNKKLKALRSKVTSPKSFELQMAQPGSKLTCLTNKPMPFLPPSHLP